MEQNILWITTTKKQTKEFHSREKWEAELLKKKGVKYPIPGGKGVKIIDNNVTYIFFWIELPESN